MKNGQDLGAMERIPTQVFENSQLAVVQLADEVEQLIRERTESGQKTVLGLATGSTPVPFYRELIRRHQENGLSFKNVITFNLDEYYPLDRDHPESYFRFMHQQLFDHIDIPEANIHIPTGICPRDKVFEWCSDYEAAIEAAGGLDIQILGIGRTGHIGFNEPGSSLQSKTRMVTLDRITRNDAAKDFLGEKHVPRHAITMGVGTIMNARKIVLMGWGSGKAEILRKTIEEAPSDSVPASYLQQHPDTRIWLDDSAASELTRSRCPWLVQKVDWTSKLERRAVSNLALSLNKSLLKLVDKDYQENGLSDLVTDKGPAYQLNIKIFNDMQHTITGWPGGKPGVDDSDRPERATPGQKRVLIFSPEPLDAVMAMGATLNRLIAQGHDVHICYMTSGSLGVPDEEAVRAAELIKEVDSNSSILDQNPKENRRLKTIIRRNETMASMKLCGARAEQIFFLNLPFYENGKYRQFTLSEEDVDVLRSLLDASKPHQVFFTGSEADPSSVQAKAYQALSQAMETLSKETWMNNCWLWEYSTSHEELDIDQIDMAVPCSPDELALKIQSIYEHGSQMQQIPRMGSSSQELWQEIGHRNQHTAKLFDQLGMAEYEAIECFRKKS